MDLIWNSSGHDFHDDRLNFNRYEEYSQNILTEALKNNVFYYEYPHTKKNVS